MQSAGEALPRKEKDALVGHETQTVAPLDEEKVPEGQGMQDHAPAGLYLPAPQIIWKRWRGACTHPSG